MAVHDTFGQASRSRRVHDEQEIVVAGHHLGFFLAGGGQNAFVMFGPFGSGILGADVDPAVYFGRSRPAVVKIGAHLCELGAEQHRFGSAVIENERKLVSHQPPVQSDGYTADFAQPVEALNELVAVHQQHRNPVAP